MKPPFKLTLKILDLCTGISRIVGQCEGLKVSAPSPQLRRHNRVRTVQSSLAIEGNTLSESQVTDIIDNKRVIGPAKDILEVKNALKAYDKVHAYDIYSYRSMLEAHKTLMNGLIKDAGNFRERGVGVFNDKRVVHMAPGAKMVPRLVADLFSFLKEADDVPLSVRSCVFHYELEYIHPFSDGNGRIGRLWQTAILCKVHPILQFVPIESLIKKKQKEYYRALALSDKDGDSTIFIEFMLNIIKTALKGFAGDLKSVVETTNTRLDSAREVLGSRQFSRNDYMKLHKNISSATASRDLVVGVKAKKLAKKGDKAITRYWFV
jgi:Fic family protein